MRLYAILILCALVPNIFSQELKNPASSETPYMEREEKQFNFYPGGKITIAAGVAGSVRVVGWQKGSVRMEAEKIVHNLPQDQAKKLIEQNPIRVRWTQTEATIQNPGLPAPPAEEDDVRVSW